MLIYFAIGKCEEDETKTHDTRGHKVQRSMSLALDQDSPNQDWDKFAAFEDNLENIHTIVCFLVVCVST